MITISEQCKSDFEENWKMKFKLDLGGNNALHTPGTVYKMKCNEKNGYKLSADYAKLECTKQNGVYKYRYTSDSGRCIKGWKNATDSEHLSDCLPENFKIEMDNDFMVYADGKPIEKKTIAIGENATLKCEDPSAIFTSYFRRGYDFCTSTPPRRTERYITATCTEDGWSNAQLTLTIRVVVVSRLDLVVPLHARLHWRCIDWIRHDVPRRRRRRRVRRWIRTPPRRHERRQMRVLYIERQARHRLGTQGQVQVPAELVVDELVDDLQSAPAACTSRRSTRNLT